MGDTNLNINVDMGRIQSSVQAAIRPAVEEALASYDIKDAIIKQLTAKSKKKRNDDFAAVTWLDTSYRYRAPLDIGSLLDQMVREGIEAIAKEYVVSNLQMQRGEIEEAFRKMMSGSTNRLVKAFAGSVENALKEDWGFQLSVEVAHTTKTGNDDD